jgi:alkaline phosphatase D
VQEDWLTANFRQRRAAWTVLAQQVPIGRFDRNPDPAVTEVHMDKWDGAEAARTRLFDAIAATGTRNVVVLAGDVHQNRANELRRNFDDPASPIMGVEFVSTSVASNGDGIDRPGNWDVIKSANPHLKYYNSQRGYVRHSISADRWQANYVTLDKVSEKDAPGKTRVRFVVESGKPRLQTL